MAYSCPTLPYAYDALEPHIDARTMEIHHDKHHAAYVTNLNAALEGTEWMDRPIDAVLASLEIIPEDKRAAVRNNGGGHANHTLFWEIMGPNGGGEPTGALGDAIADTFGGFARPEERRDDAGIKRFGSGWSWLVWDGNGPRGAVDAEPGLAGHGRQDAAARHRRLGARLLPQLPEPPPRLPRGVVERRRLGRGRARSSRVRVQRGVRKPASPSTAASRGQSASVASVRSTSTHDCVARDPGRNTG